MNSALLSTNCLSSQSGGVPRLVVGFFCEIGWPSVTVAAAQRPQISIIANSSIEASRLLEANLIVISHSSGCASAILKLSTSIPSTTAATVLPATRYAVCGKLAGVNELEFVFISACRNRSELCRGLRRRSEIEVLVPGSRDVTYRRA